MHSSTFPVSSTTSSTDSLITQTTENVTNEINQFYFYEVGIFIATIFGNLNFHQRNTSSKNFHIMC